MTTESDVLDLLAQRYQPPAWAFLRQVRNATGYDRQIRTADAVAMGLWPSRGLELLGFEVKVSRADWLRELRDPKKAEDIFRFMDGWYIVAAPGIIEPGELPATWGLLVPRGKRLVAQVEAPKLDSQAVDRLFLASLCRSVMGTLSPKAVLARARAEGKLEGLEEGKRIAEGRLRTHEEFEKRVAVFENAAGIRINKWTPPENLGEAVRLVLAGEDKHVGERLKRVRDQVAMILEDTDRILAGKTE